MQREATKTARAQRICDATNEAYSFPFFGVAEWTKAIRFLIDMSYTDKQIEKIMRSKWTRWARDSYAGPDDGDYGQAKGEWVERFVTEYAGKRGYLVSSL